MEIPQDQSTLNTPSAVAVTATADRNGINLASLDGATADGPRGDAGLQSSDRLLDIALDDPPLDIGPLDVGALERPTVLAEAAYPAFHDDDLPAPLFHEDDLPVPSFDDDDLPAPSIHDYDLPADLTRFGLGQLLGLGLKGGALPTVGEVVRVAFRQDSANQSDTEETQAAEDEDEGLDLEAQEPGLQITDAGDLSFIENLSLPEQAAAHEAEIEIDDVAGAELFSLGMHFANEAGPEKFDAHVVRTVTGPQVPAENAKGSGAGANVINGTAGDDGLNGTAGNDLIHGLVGNDTLDGGGGSDRLDGGLGDDVMVWDSADARIDGKGGSDTLRVAAGDADFTVFGGDISNVEQIDLVSDAGANAVTLTAQNVLDMTDNGNTLTLFGDAGDSLDASNDWTDGGFDGGGNHIYTQIVGPNTAMLIVDSDISVNANILL